MKLQQSIRRHCELRVSRGAKQSITIAASILLLLFLPPVLLRLLPFPELADFCAQEYSCRIYDRRGELIQVTAIKGGGRREFTPINQIPKSVQKGFIQQEDKRFYFHHGVDYLSLIRAAIQNNKANKIVSGGSTITMQLAKTLSKDNSITLSRKFKNILLAYRIEAKLSKKAILELYLNSIYFGANSYGVTSAARSYYGCELNQLSPEQILVLSIIPRNPTYYNPVDHKEHFENFTGQTNQAVDNALQEAGYYKYQYKLPHFINYLSTNKANQFELHTTVDLEISDFAQSFLRQALEQAKSSRITNASLLLLNNEDGSVLAWLGNGDFFDDTNCGQIDGVLTKNQPGSSMKPFLYALAIEKDLLQPSTVLADIPSEFGNEKLYIPENFNNRYNGPVRARIALASSLNIPTVSTLNQLGVQNYLEKLYELGFDSLRQNDAGLKADLGLALGAGEVSLYELVPAFSVFVRDGFYLPIKINQNEKLTNGRQLYSSDTARIITSILSDKSARALGFGYSQTFQTSYPSIFKTGTSNQYQNIIALGATEKYTIGVWMGNFSGNTVIGKTGASLPAWVARKVLDQLEESNQAFPQPEHYHKERICSLSGLKAGPHCHAVVSEYVKDGNPLQVCNWHQEIKGNVQTILPPEYQKWLRSQSGNTFIEHSVSPLTIQTPNDNSMFFYSNLNKDKQAIPFEVSGGSNNTLIVYYDEKKFTTISRPFLFNLPVERGEHSCRMLCGNEEVTVSFTVR